MMGLEPDEFVGDEDVTEEFEASRRPMGMVVSVRLGPDDAEKLVTVAEESGRTVSQVARQAIRTFLAFAGQKTDALEMTVATEGSLGLVIRLPAFGSPTQVDTTVRVGVEEPVYQTAGI